MWLAGFERERRLTPPPGSEPPRWVVWSTHASINAGTPSLTAIVETMVAVPLYWWLAIHFETFLPLLVSAFVAPLVLLRSDASVALGVRLFTGWEKRFNDSRKWSDLSARERGYVGAAVIASAAGAGVLSYMTAKTFIAGQEGWSAVWRGAILGYGVGVGVGAGALTVAGAGAGATEAGEVFARAVVVAGWAAGAGALVAAGGAAAAGVLGVLVVFGAAAASGEGGGARARAFAEAGMLPVLLGGALGVFLVSVAIRIFGTLRHPAAGLKSLPDNFRRLVFCTSPLQTPELVPGLAENETEFTLVKQLQKLKKNRKSEKVFAYLFLPPAIILWFGPAWCYRFILKSTAWFWWPLAFLGGEARLAKTPDKFYRKTLSTLWARTNIALAILAILSFIVLNFKVAVFESNPLVTVLGYFLLVDWSSRAWQLFAVILPVMSLAIVFLVDDAVRDYDAAEKKNDGVELAHAKRKLSLIEMSLVRPRFIVTFVYVILVGGQTLLYFNSSACWVSVPANVQTWAEFFYGPRTPPPPTCFVHAGGVSSKVDEGRD